MKNRLLGFVMILMFLCGSCFPASAVGFTDTDDTKYETAANVLSALGFINGRSDGTFDVAGTMTRAEFASILAKLALVSGISSGDVYFFDVKSDYWAKDAINIVCTQGLMSGSDKYFRPDEAVTLEEVSQGLAVLLGYGNMARSKSYVSIAVSLGIYKNISTESKICRGDILLAVYNALSVDLAAASGIDDEGNITGNVSKGANILTEHFDIYKASGQFTAVGDLDLLRTINKQTGYVKIDDVAYTLADGVKAGKEFLAYSVDYYYHDAGGNEMPELLYYSINKNNEIIEADADHIEEGQCTTTRFAYLDENLKVKKQEISSSAKFIYNGYIISDADKIDSLFQIDSGSVKVVLPANGLNEVVWINNYEYHLVRASGTKSLFLKDGTELDLDGDRDDLEVNFFTSTGEPTTIDEVVSNSAVALAEVNAADGITYRNIHVLNSVTGTVTEAGNLSVAVDGKEYDAASGIASQNIVAGMAYTFYIGLDGKICLFDENTSELLYGYLIDVDLKTEGVRSEVQFKIMNTSGEKVIYAAADKFYVNDKMVKQESLAQAFGTAFYQYLYDRGNAKPIRQVIAYMENTEGQILKIYTPSEEHSKLKRDVEPATRQCKGSSIFSFGGVLTVSDTGVIFAVPEDKDNADDNAYDVLEIQFFINDNLYMVEGYNVNELFEADVLVVTIADADSAYYNEGNTHFCVFDKKTKVLLDDGTESYAITYWQQGAQFTKNLANREGKRTYTETLREVQKLARGDCFKVELTGDNTQIKNISIEFQQANRTESANAYNGERIMFYGQIQAVGVNSLVIRKFSPIGDNYLGSVAYLFKNAGRVYTYLYTGEDRPVQKVENSLADARVGDWVMYQTRYGACRSMIIYRDDDRLPTGKLK